MSNKQRQECNNARMEKRKIILFLIPSIATFHPCNLAAKDF